MWIFYDQPDDIGESQCRPGGRVETWVEWGLEFPVVEHVKGVLDKSEWVDRWRRFRQKTWELSAENMGWHYDSPRSWRYFDSPFEQFGMAPLKPSR